MHENISNLRNKGMTFAKIATRLNENGYTTVRDKQFHRSHVHSILEKKRDMDMNLN
tara:strand:- start:459 stop:626 length:168 start_codon:yes stop_codon:yes gene_type:complete